MMARYNLPLNVEGVVVTDPGPYGGRVGLNPGDILLGINDAATETPRQVDRALRNPGRRVRMDVMRQGRRLSLRFRA